MVIWGEHMQPTGIFKGDPGRMQADHHTGKGIRGKNDKTSGRGKGKGNWGGKAHRVNPPKASGGSGKGGHMADTTPFADSNPIAPEQQQQQQLNFQLQQTFGHIQSLQN
eukprot:1452951-Karenia_brevis.AAC.1